MCGGSGSPAVYLLATRNTPKGEAPVTQLGLRDLPKQNPCAQCGQPIAAPDWVEEEEGRTIYLWYCRACDYCFEAIAYEAAEIRSLAA
jgi:hypothetical protein